MSNSWWVRCVFTGFLFVTGASSLLADPIVRQDAPVEDEASRSGSGGMLPIVQDAVREVRRAGPGVTPTVFGIDDGFLVNGNLLHSELRQAEALPRSTRTTRNADGNQDIFGEVIDDALKAARGALFDGSDTASFSLAGFDLSVTLNSDRRALSVNGLELGGSNPKDDQDIEALPIMLPATGDVGNQSQVLRQLPIDTETPTFHTLVTKVRKFVFHPMTILGTIAVVGLWLVFLVAETSRRRS